MILETPRILAAPSLPELTPKRPVGAWPLAGAEPAVAPEAEAERPGDLYVMSAEMFFAAAASAQETAFAMAEAWATLFRTLLFAGIQGAKGSEAASDPEPPPSPGEAIKSAEVDRVPPRRPRRRSPLAASGLAPLSQGLPPTAFAAADGASQVLEA